MSRSCSRREFLTASTGLMAGIGIDFLLPDLASAQTGPRMCVSCRDANLPRLGMQDCWEAMKAIGAEGVEAAIDDDLSFSAMFHPSKKYSAATVSGIEQLKADAQAAGRRITALLMMNRFDQRPEFDIEWCTKVAHAAQALGVTAIRIDVASSKLSKDALLDLDVATMNKILKATESTGVAFGVENHGSANDPEFLRPLLARVTSPRFGLTLDTGNFYWYGFPRARVHELCAEFAPRIVHTHCKSICFPEDKRDVQRPVGWGYAEYCCPLYEGDIDFRRVVATLKKAGYAGDLCVEDESLGRFPEADRAGILRREVEYLKQMLT